MLEVIALAVWGFGTLSTWFLARTAKGQVAVMLVSVVTLGLGVITAQDARREIARLEEIAKDARFQASLDSTRALLGSIEADTARLKELCAMYPGTKGC